MHRFCFKLRSLLKNRGNNWAFSRYDGRIEAKGERRRSGTLRGQTVESAEFANMPCCCRIMFRYGKLVSKSGKAQSGIKGWIIVEFVIIIVLCIVVAVLIAGLLFQTQKGNHVKRTGDYTAQFEILKNQIMQLQTSTANEFANSRRDSDAYQKSIREENAKSLTIIADKMTNMTKENAEHQLRLNDTISSTLNSIRVKNEEQNERQTAKIADAILKMQESNEKRLDQMRQTVDEKLTSTLTTRLDSSFKTVSEQLENVYKSLGEMKELSGGITNGVNSLNRIMTNVKSRGTWAEVQLQNILDQTIPGMYERNFAPRANSSERVEFAVRIPSGESGKQIIYLPIDSKFPIEDYIRLCEAADAADAEAVQHTRKALEDRVLAEARTIQRYINIPVTTPYAILYLATEGLYAEIASSRNGLPERIQRDYNIMIAGPNTITALLNSLSMGFRAVAINEKANEVRQLLAVAKAQYEKFGIVLEKAKRKIEEAGQTLSEAQDRNRIIQSKLKKVESIDVNQAEAILTSSDGEVSADEPTA